MSEAIMSMPTLSRPASIATVIPDCIVALAYGRNDIDDKELNKTIAKIRSECTTPEEAFARLQAEGFEPGDANYRLANQIIETDRLYGGTTPWIFPQWEIAYAMWRRTRLLSQPNFWFNDRNRGRIIVLWPEKNEDGYRAFHVLRDAKKRMNECQGHNKKSCRLAAIVAAKPMLFRTERLAKKQGIRFLVPRPAKSVLSIYSDQSVQWQTRSPMKAHFYELLALTHHLIHRWI